MNIDSKKTITMAHGSGGMGSAWLMREVFGRHFSNGILGRLEDAAVVRVGSADDRCSSGCAKSVVGADGMNRADVADGADGAERASVADGVGNIVVSTDSFVVTPTVFPGGDIGKLAICGTVNDVLMMGALPCYLTCGFILEEGLNIDLLDCICASMARAASEAGVTIIAGDTKVIERRDRDRRTDRDMRDIGTPARPPARTKEGIPSGVFNMTHDALPETATATPSLFINTTGIGFLRDIAGSGRAFRPTADAARSGDVVIVSGDLGDHHACILSARLSLKNGIRSDCAALNDIVDALYDESIETHALRDVTRGGLGTVLNEIAASSNISIEIDEESIPVSDEVKAFCGIMGLDPLYMGNEGKLVAIVAEKDTEHALATMRRTKNGANARIIGSVVEHTKPVNRTYSLMPETATGDAPTSVVHQNPNSSARPDTSHTTAAVIVKTKIGGSRRLPILQGEGLPRIC